MLLVVSSDKGEDVQQLTKAAAILGWEIYSGGWIIPKYLTRCKGAVYGSSAFCENIAEQMGWKLLANPDDWVEILPQEYATDAPVITSRYRCFVKDRTVVASSCYWLKSIKMATAEINRPENYGNNHEAVIEFVSKMLDDEKIKCAPSAAIDVVRYRKDTYTVIDSFPTWSSNICGCEVVGVLDAISASCVSKEDQQ